MQAGEKFRVEYLNFDFSKKRAFTGMSSIKNVDVTLRMPFLLAELAEKDFFWYVAVCSNFVVFSKTNMIYSFILLWFVLERF